MNKVWNFISRHILLICISLLAAIAAVFQGVESAHKSDVTLFVIRYLGFGWREFTATELTMLLTDMFPIFIFEIIMGIHIYKHFLTASVYYFSRQNNRVHWFINQVLQLLLASVIYYVTYLAGSYIIYILITGASINFQSLWILLYLIALYTMFSCVFTLLMNIVAIIMGSQFSYLLVMGIQLSSAIMLLYFYQKEIVGKLKKIFCLHPISNVVITWHSNIDSSVYGMKSLDIDFLVIHSFLYYMILFAIIFGVGIFIIKRSDIGLHDKDA